MKKNSCENHPENAGNNTVSYEGYTFRLFFGNGLKQEAF